jgi:Rad3-related DNA helicase
MPLRVLERVARDKACEHPDKACHGDSCPLAQGFYDRLPAARQAAAQARWLSKTTLRQVALEHTVCPYYLGQEMLRWSDVAVGDFNHYFDHGAAWHALTEANGWRVGLLVDEAHNLIERARRAEKAAGQTATPLEHAGQNANARPRGAARAAGGVHHHAAATVQRHRRPLCAAPARRGGRTAAALVV